MFSHLFISVTDFDAAFDFYHALMAELGLELRFCDWEKSWAGWHKPVVRGHC